MDGGIHTATTTSSVVRKKLADSIGARSCTALLLFGVADLFGLGPASSTSTGILAILVSDETWVVAKLHEHLDGAETVDLLAIKDVLRILRIDKVLVHILLNFGEVAAYNLNELGGQMLCIQSIHTTEDEFVNGGTHFILHFGHLVLLPLSSIRLSTAEDREEVVLSEFFLRSKDAGVDEINHGKELLQIILHGCTGQQNAALTRKRKQSPGGLILPVLESMGLITN
mmetsp:Transcript_24734/g.71410  ORF Transcript_24734/g.71410 Transcript_24734/m.71410 type:complete len:227 (+) Transcript_24734:262-942(+)